MVVGVHGLVGIGAAGNQIGLGIFFQVSGAAEHGQVQRVQQAALSEAPRPGSRVGLRSGDGDVHPYPGAFDHAGGFRFPDFRFGFPRAGTGQRQQRYEQQYFLHRLASAQVNISLSTWSSPQYQESYTQRIRAFVTLGASVTFPLFLLTLMAPLADQ